MDSSALSLQEVSDEVIDDVGYPPSKCCSFCFCCTGFKRSKAVMQALTVSLGDAASFGSECRRRGQKTQVLHRSCEDLLEIVSEVIFPLSA